MTKEELAEKYPPAGRSVIQKILSMHGAGVTEITLEGPDMQEFLDRLQAGGWLDFTALTTLRNATQIVGRSDRLREWMPGELLGRIMGYNWYAKPPVS